MKNLLTVINEKIDGIGDELSAKTRNLEKRKLLFSRKNLAKGDEARFEFRSVGETSAEIKVESLASSQTTAIVSMKFNGTTISTDRIILPQGETVSLAKDFSLRGGGRLSVKIASPLGPGFSSSVSLTVTGYGAEKLRTDAFISLVSTEDSDFFLTLSDGIVSFIDENLATVKTYSDGEKPFLGKIYDSASPEFLPLVGFVKNGKINLDLPSISDSSSVSLASSVNAESADIVTFGAEKSSFLIFTSGGKLYGCIVSAENGSLSVGNPSDIFPSVTAATNVRAYSFGDEKLCVLKVTGGTYGFKLGISGSLGNYSLQKGAENSLPLKETVSAFAGTKNYLYHRGKNGVILRSEIDLSGVPVLISSVKELFADAFLRFSPSRGAFISDGDFFLADCTKL